MSMGRAYIPKIPVQMSIECWTAGEPYRGEKEQIVANSAAVLSPQPPGTPELPPSPYTKTDNYY